MVESTIETNYASWLAIARHVASLLRSSCLPPNMIKMAEYLMRLEFWIRDIALECRDMVRRDSDGTELSTLVGRTTVRHPTLLTNSRAGVLRLH